MPRVLVGGDLQRFGAKPGRLYRLTRFWILRRSFAALMEDSLFARLQPRLTPDSREESLEPRVVILAPLLEGVMVALCTLNSHSEEQLRRVLQLLLRVFHLAVPDDRRVFAGLARRGHDFADKLIV